MCFFGVGSRKLRRQGGGEGRRAKGRGRRRVGAGGAGGAEGERKGRERDFVSSPPGWGWDRGRQNGGTWRGVLIAKEAALLWHFTRVKRGRGGGQRWVESLSPYPGETETLKEKGKRVEGKWGKDKRRI